MKLFKIALFSLIFLCNTNLFSQTQISGNDELISKYWKTFSFKFSGTLDFGKETSMPCWPENSSYKYAGGGAPVNGYGFGIEIDFRPIRNLVLFFDPIEVNDLFYDGWTWESTAGEHAILPYRLGIALGF